jgi:hypothetical protein
LYFVAAQPWVALPSSIGGKLTQLDWPDPSGTRKAALFKLSASFKILD